MAQYKARYSHKTYNENEQNPLLENEIQIKFQNSNAPDLYIGNAEGEAIKLNNKTTEDIETIIKNNLVPLSLSAELNPDDQAPTASSVASQLVLKSEGVNANYNFTSPGWKRILNIIRATNGSLNLGIAKSRNGYMTQALGIDFTGFVQFPSNEFTNSKPVIYQRYNNLFGIDPNLSPAKRAEITKIRVGYPIKDYSTNPINCYVDIYVDFEPREGSEDFVAFNMAYSGKAASHNTSAIITETPAEDIGIYGEELEYYEFEVKRGPDIYTLGEIEASKFIGDIEAKKIIANEIYSVGENEVKEFNTTDNFVDAKVVKDSIDSSIIDTITAYKKYNYIYNTLKSTTKNGVEITAHPSGAMTLNGTCTKGGTVNLFNGYTSTNPILYLPAGTYKSYGLRFILWDIGVTPSANTIQIIENRNELIPIEFTIDKPKFLGHTSIYIQTKISYNESFVPYLYRVEDDLNISYSYDEVNDVISIYGTDKNYDVDIVITDKNDLYSIPMKGEGVLKLDNSRIIEDSRIISNNYTILVAEDSSNTFEVKSYIKLDARESSKIEVDSELSSTSTNPVQNKAITKELNNCIKRETESNGVYESKKATLVPGTFIESNPATDGSGGFNATLTIEHHYGNTILSGNSFFIGNNNNDSYFTITIGLAGGEEAEIDSSESVKQAFKNWLGIS